tara:strand:- start:505 stop:1215 length:711 start_codon:yes stop_codon:yes gene_type:complete
VVRQVKGKYLKRGLRLVFHLPGMWKTNLLLFAFSVLSNSFANGLVQGTAGRPMGGRPVVFSAGLFNTMPSFLYNTVLKELRKNATIIVAPAPLTRRSFEDLCDEFQQDKLPLLAHSSLDFSVLDSHRLERAMLIDPSAVPAVGVNGLVPVVVSPRAPTSVILSKLYAKFVKSSFQPKIEEASVIQYESGGHSDLLDGFWAAVAGRVGIPSDPTSRNEFRAFVTAECEKWIHDGIGT